MIFTIENRQFELQWFSEVNPRDGAGCDLWEHEGEEKTLVAEVFRHDALQKIVFATYNAVEVPLQAIEELLKTFNVTGARNFVADSPQA